MGFKRVSSLAFLGSFAFPFLQPFFLSSFFFFFFYFFFFGSSVHKKILGSFRPTLLLG